MAFAHRCTFGNGRGESSPIFKGKIDGYLRVRQEKGPGSYKRKTMSEKVNSDLIIEDLISDERYIL